MSLNLRAVRLALTAAAAASTIVARPAGAQADLEIDGSRVRAGVDSMVVYFVNGRDTTRAGFVRDEITVVTEGGQTLLRRVYRASMGPGNLSVDTIVDVQGTLAPVRYWRTEDGVRQRVIFSPGRVRSWSGEGADLEPMVDEPLPSPVYNGSTVDLVIRSAPLAEGWSAEIPAYLISEDVVATLAASVAGVETIGGRPCWRVEVDFADVPVTFWIDQETRRTRQQVMTIGHIQVLFRLPGITDRPSRST